jgi:hypothetical protein
MSIITFFIVQIIEIITIIGIIGGYFIIKKNKKLENIIQKQQETMVNISDTIEYIDIKLDEIDSKGIFRADDEVGFFFEGLKEIQRTLNAFKIE